MGLMDDVFDMREFVKRKKAAKACFESIEEALWSYEDENERLWRMISDIAKGEQARKVLEEYVERYLDGNNGSARDRSGRDSKTNTK